MANYPYVNYAQPSYGYGQAFNPYQTMPQNGSQASVQSIPMQQSVVSAPVSQPGFVCRPVASKEEAKAVPTDFQGNILVMTDFPNNAIYTKALNPATGSAQFETYQRVIEQETSDQTVPTVNVPDYSAVFSAFGDQLNQITERIDELVDKVEKFESKPKATVKSNGKAVEV